MMSESSARLQESKLKHTQMVSLYNEIRWIESDVSKMMVVHKQKMLKTMTGKEHRLQVLLFFLYFFLPMTCNLNLMCVRLCMCLAATQIDALLEFNFLELCHHMIPDLRGT